MRTRIGALDGIRGLALLAVLAYHTGPGVFSGGFLGVEMFFVLSGYLLTSLLLREHTETGGIDHRRYAVRRVRRLVPAGLVLLAVLFLVVPVVAGEDAHRLRGDLLSSLSGLTNWHLISDGSSYFDSAGRPPFVRHLWSLAVEIQFCLVCSILAAWLARRSRTIAATALGGAVALSAVVMAVLYRSPDPSRVYYGTDTRLGALLAGALLAVVITHPVVERFSRLRGLRHAAVGVLALLVLFTDQVARWLYPSGFLLTQIATIVLIVAAVQPGRASAALSAAPLRWFGERSYGIYLWHWPVVVLMRPGIDVTWHPFVTALVTIGIAVGLGACSYRFVEKPALRAPRVRVVWSALWSGVPRQARFTASAAALAIIAAFTGLAVRLPTSDPIAESLRAGEEVLAAQVPLPATAAPSVKTVAPRPQGGGGSLAAAAPAPAPRPAPAPALRTFRPGSISVTAIGDSVMVGAAGALHAKLGGKGYIDAVKNRRFSEAAQIVRDLRARGALGRIVVVHLGNNGPVKPEEIDALVHEVKGIQKLLVLTVRVNRPWQDPVNNELRAGAGRHASMIKLVDWHAYSEGHPDWFHSDGTHLRTAGAEEYAKIVTGSIPPPPPEPTPKPTPKPTPTPDRLLPKIIPPPDEG